MLANLSSLSCGSTSPNVDSAPPEWTRVRLLRRATGDRHKVARKAIRPPKFSGLTTNVTQLDQIEDTNFDANFNTDTHIVEMRWDMTEDYRLDAIYGISRSSASRTPTRARSSSKATTPSPIA